MTRTLLDNGENDAPPLDRRATILICLVAAAWLYCYIGSGVAAATAPPGQLDGLLGAIGPIAVWFQWQVAALAVAFLSGVLTFITRNHISSGTQFVGYIPVAFSGLFGVGLLALYLRSLF